MAGRDDLEPSDEPRRAGSGCLWLMVAAIALVILGIGFYGLFAFGFGRAPAWSSSRSVCAQPDDRSYEEGASYSVFVWEPSFPLTLNPAPPRAVVGRSGANGSSGVPVELSASTDPGRVICRWNPDDVEIVEPDGIVHIVPASVFTGGR